MRNNNRKSIVNFDWPNPPCVCLILSLGSLDVLGAFFFFNFFDVELRWVVMVVERKFCSDNYSFLSWLFDSLQLVFVVFTWWRLWRPKRHTRTARLYHTFVAIYYYHLGEENGCSYGAAAQTRRISARRRRVKKHLNGGPAAAAVMIVCVQRRRAHRIQFARNPPTPPYSSSFSSSSSSSLFFSSFFYPFFLYSAASSPHHCRSCISSCIII